MSAAAAASEAVDAEALLAACQDAVRRARRAGADEVEVYANGSRKVSVGFQKNDLNLVGSGEERTLGVRLLRDRRQGFATTNRLDRLDEAIEAALALAAVAPPDAHLGLPQPAEALASAPAAADAALLGDSDPAALARLGAETLAALAEEDDRVTVDTLELEEAVRAVAIASSTGIAAAHRSTTASGTLFGMAVSGEEVGSFAVDGARVRTRGEFARALAEARRRFVAKTTGALGAQPGESFRGPVLVPPEAFESFLLRPLVAMLKADAVRQGQSPLAERVGEAIASSGFTFWDEGLGLDGFPLAPFDREGQARRRRPLVQDGVLQGFLYDAYEARRAGTRPTGDATGSAAAAPRIDTAAVSVEAGDTDLDALLDVPRGVIMTRFSGSIEPTTGDFSGVVKGGFLLSGGERRPIRETTVAGNVWDCLKRISAISREREVLFGASALPWVRVEDVAITAG